MSIPSPHFMLSPAALQSRLQTLAAEGRTVRVEELEAGAVAILTSFIYVSSGEVWLLEPGADPWMAQIDHKAMYVVGGRLVLDALGQPAAMQEVRRRGVQPLERVPRV